MLDNAGEDEPSDILTSFMLQFYAEECLPPREILVSDGVEDADASRRVEFKFSLKDSEMIEEMNRILSEDTDETAQP